MRRENSVSTATTSVSTALLNENFLKLKAGHPFPETERRVRARGQRLSPRPTGKGKVKWDGPKVLVPKTVEHVIQSICVYPQ